MLTAIIADADGQQWATVVSLIANMGFPAVVGWYLLTKAIPKMQADAKTDVDAARQGFLEELRQQRAQHDLAYDRLRSESKANLEAVLSHCEKEAERRDETMRVEFRLMTQAMQEFSEVLETLRGDWMRGAGMPAPEPKRPPPGGPGKNHGGGR